MRLSVRFFGNAYSGMQTKGIARGKEVNVRLVTWNINSVRLRLPLIARLAATLAPDVVCLQEIKVQTADFPREALAGLGYTHQHVVGMKGYNGTAILSRIPLHPLPVQSWCAKEDARHAAVRLPDGTELHNFYVPAGGDIPDPAENEKFSHKLAFLKEMTAWSHKGRKASRILVGDLNIAPLPEDVWSHKQLLDVVSHTPVEVEALTRLQESAAWVDSARHLRPPPEKLYSWWSYRSSDWAKANKGRRLDHIWLSPDLLTRLQRGDSVSEARGWTRPSDHVPVWVDLTPDLR